MGGGRGRSAWGRQSRTNIHLDVALSDGEITADTIKEGEQIMAAWSTPK